MPGMTQDSIHESKGAGRVKKALVLLVSALTIVLWWTYTPGGLLGKADAVGYAVCHRIDLRSFHLGVRSMPLCARCTGMYLGVVAAFLYYAVRRPRAGLYPDKRTFALLGLIALLWAADGLNSYVSLFPGELNLYPPNNVLRLTTGMLLGVALSSVVYPTFHQVAWVEWEVERALRSPVELLLVVGVAAIPTGMVLTANPLLLYPLALVSAAGVLLMLTLVYTTMLLALFRLENRLRDPREITLPLFGGLTLAILQIGLIDLLRFWITGTWDGFHL
jgi:uncharacterized membrane protein